MTRSCRQCHCTDADCSQCIAETGEARHCSWRAPHYSADELVALFSGATA